MSNDLHIRLLPDGTNARVDAAARAYANVAGIGGTIADRRRAWLLATLAQSEAAVKAAAHVAAAKPVAATSKKAARPAVVRGKSPTTEGMQALGRYLYTQTRISQDVRHTRYQAGYSALFVVETEVPPVSMDAITRRTGLCLSAAVRATKDLIAAGVVIADGDRYERVKVGMVSPRARDVLDVLCGSSMTADDIIASLGGMRDSERADVMLAIEALAAGGQIVAAATDAEGNDVYESREQERA